MDVVLLHGFTHTGASWDPVVGRLGERYRALAPDIRGHGSASDRRPVTLARVVDDALSVASGEMVLAGYSMGGRIALHVALAAPARVRRLVLIGASPGLADPLERTQRRASDERLARELDAIAASGAGGAEAFAVFLERWASTPVLSGQAPEVLQAARRDRLQNTAPGLAAALRGLGAGVLPPLWERLGELTMPVSLIVGERDQKFREIALEMGRRLPDAALIVVPDAGHAVHLEAAAVVAEQLGAGPSV